MSALPPFPFPQGGTQPQPGGVIQPPGGYNMPKPSIATGLIDGLNQFVQSYIASKNANRDTYRQQFEQALSDRMQGIPVADEHLAKLAKMSGMKLPIYSEGERMDYQSAKNAQEADQQAQNDLLTASQVPGLAGAAAGGALQNWQSAPPATPPTPQPAPRPKGIWQRMTDVMRPPTAAQAGPGSPFSDWLKQLDQGVAAGGGLPGAMMRAGKTAQTQFELSELEAKLTKNLGVPTQALNMQQQQMLLHLGMRALQGDEDARNTLILNNVINGLPMDQVVQMAVKAGMPFSQAQKAAGQIMLQNEMGIPKFKLAMIDMAQKMLPYFSQSGDPFGQAMQYVNDPAGSLKRGITPLMPMEDWAKLIEGETKLQDAYPDSDPTNVRLYGLSQALGGTAIGTALEKASAAHLGKSKGAQDLRVRLMDANSQASQALSSASRAQTEAGRLGLDTEIDRGRLNLEIAKGIYEAAGEQGKQWQKIMEDPNSTAQEIAKATDGLASAISKQAQIPVNYAGHTYYLADPVKAVREGRANPRWYQTGGMPEVQLIDQGYNMGEPGHVSTGTQAVRKKTLTDNGLTPEQVWKYVHPGTKYPGQLYPKPAPKPGETSDTMGDVSNMLFQKGFVAPIQ